MNGGEEVLQIKIEDQFAPHMPKRIGLDAALPDKAVDGRPSLIDRPRAAPGSTFAEVS
jgi:hypothetical protein